MAKLEKQQTARCVSIKSITFKNRRGDMETKNVYLMSLDDCKDERYYFEIFESKYFKANLNEVFTPSLVVDKRPYNDKKTGEARNRNELMVNWEKAG